MGIEVSCSQWEGSACTQGVLFFSFKFWGGGGGKRKIFFIFPLFQQVPNVFPMGFLLSFGGETGGGGRGRFFSFFLCSNRFAMCSPWVFPIAPCFNPICFAQSPPLLTYIGGPKGEALHLSIESSIFVSLHSFNFFLPGPIKFNKKKLDL